jgi:hypothetical protein
MSIWFTVATVAAVVNVLLLGLLCVVWSRNYRQFRSKHTLGLLTFGVFLLAENLLAAYVYLADPTLSAWFSSAVPDVAWFAMMSLRVLETGGLAVLAYVTWD